MTAQIFMVVVCLLLLKDTLEVAASTTPRGRKPRSAAVTSAGVRRRIQRLPRRWGVALSLGLLVALTGWVSDRPFAPVALVSGAASTQVGVFLAGVRWARRPRRPTRNQRHALAAPAALPTLQPQGRPRRTLSP